MKIGLDVTPLTAPLSGVGRYTLELLRALLRGDPSVELTLLSHRPLRSVLAEPELAALPVIAGRATLRLSAWIHAALPRHLAGSGIELCHYLNYQAPLIGRTPYVLTLHDLSLLLDPHSHPRSRVVTLRPLLGTMARRAAAVMCPSRHVATEVADLLDVPQERIHVIPNAASELFRPMEPDAAGQMVASYELRPGYLLAVGTIEPRKNLLRVVSAYSRLRHLGFSEPLVICGGWGWKSSDLRPLIEQLGLTDHVKVVGFVPDDDLVGLLNAAALLVYPSLYEGFGLPILEAMACGTPVVTSDRGAMAEIAGEAALLVDPEDVDSIAGGLERVTSDQNLRASLASAGLERARQFSWAANARSTVAVYRSALGLGLAAER